MPEAFAIVATVLRVIPKAFLLTPAASIVPSTAP